eukprot:1908573-Rhodomonas_salina.1
MFKLFVTALGPDAARRNLGEIQVTTTSSSTSTTSVTTQTPSRNPHHAMMMACLAQSESL